MADALVLALGLIGFATVEAAKDLTLEGVLGEAAALRPDVVLLDLYLGYDRTSIPMIAPLVANDARVLVVTGSREPHLLAECLEAGAWGLFDKSQSFEQLLESLRDAILGHVVMQPSAREALLASLRSHRAAERQRELPFATLTHREGEVLKLLCAGISAEEIAAREYLSLATIRSHIRAILRKLGVNSQLAAVVLAQRSGWVDQ